MTVLGIETSCDETAVGIVENGKTLLANAVFSSMDLHTKYGGVVPEIAARSHIESMMPVIKEALDTAFPSRCKHEIRNPKSETKPKIQTENSLLENATNQATEGCELLECDPWNKIDAIAVTYGAGLGGSLLVGVMTARTLAITKKKPLYAINHVEAHVYANFLTDTTLPDYTLPSVQPEFPLLALIVSGGHTQLALFQDHFEYRLLGQTRDDAIGEAFDKVAKIVGLPYPGGPSVAKAALHGNPHKYTFPKSRLDQKYEFSFSGVKTAVLRLAQEEIGEDFTFPSMGIAKRLSEAQRNDIAASFQRVAMETVVDKTVLAVEEFQPRSIVIAGGVAANTELRQQLSEKLPISIEYTDTKLCTDNGAMIATLGCYKAMLGEEAADPYSLEIAPNLSM